MFFPGRVDYVNTETGYISVVTDDKRYFENVIPITIASRGSGLSGYCKGGIIAVPSMGEGNADGDRCLLFFDSTKKPYALFTWLATLDGDVPTLKSNFPDELSERDIWLGNVNTGICIRDVGYLELRAAPLCSINLNMSNNSITLACEQYFLSGSGCEIAQETSTITGIKHSEYYYDIPGTPSGNSYEYIVADALGVEKIKVEVDKTGPVTLNFNQVSVTIDNVTGTSIKSGSPATTEVTIDTLGNVTINTQAKLSLNGAQIGMGQNLKGHATIAEPLLTWAVSHTHPYLNVNTPSFTSPPVIPPPIATITSTKVLLE